jgi:N6-L-threonylcarbamoyladenine synthase
MPGFGLILAIESSCDETAAAVVQRGSRTLSSVVASQIATHARYGGVVPELASREHLRAIVPVVRAALAQANVTLADLDAIAVTNGPGLAGALLVGITYAKALAFAQKLPLIAVNHLEGHIHAVLLNERESASNANSPQKLGAPSISRPLAEWVGDQEPEPGAPPLGAPSIPRPLAEWVGDQEPHQVLDTDPALALVVSGGHTHLYLARPANNTWRYTLIGRTLDDAAGEAYDKVAKLLGLGYPGGPWIDALAQFGNPHAVPFAFSQIKPKLHLAGKPPRTKAASTAPIANLDPHFLFSFSGIKTAVLRYVELHNLRPEAESRREALFNHETEALKGLGFSRAINATQQSRALAPEGSFPPKPPTTKAQALALCPQLTLDLIASFQHAVVGDLMKKTFAAAESLAVSRILITGGVAANRELRSRFTAEACHPERSGAKSKDLHFRISFPTLALSTDNAAMIAAAAWPRFISGDFAPSNLSADPSLALGR